MSFFWGIVSYMRNIALLGLSASQVICLCHQRAIFQGAAVDLPKWLEEPGSLGNEGLGERV